MAVLTVKIKQNISLVNKKKITADKLVILASQSTNLAFTVYFLCLMFKKVWLVLIIKFAIN